ncbi:Toll-like receptor 3 [Acropora cervicornis]|uniref:Toll-like receptor 3 n=1 Tax=Acropora cervicornis TaxID=6130 RepID=A0AAD9QXZ7_ACRCE|nr:Toll-like receptor 3 [Acropora cervicornis]
MDLKDASYRSRSMPITRNIYFFEWKSELWEFSCLPFELSSAPRVFTKVMKLLIDASHTSWGVTFENQSTNGEWSMEERKQPIDWLELKTVLLELQSFLSSACGGNVIKVFCDNSTAVASEKSGSDSADVKGYFIVGEWNEILCVKTVKNISTRKELNTSHEFKYHAFIIYSQKDELWLTKKILPLLEERNELKCCIHYRDFEPGKLFHQAMADCVYKSHKVIALISRNVFASNYCN